MKTPLRYQATHFDCGPSSLVNALVYLFERDEIPYEAVRFIESATCDRYLGRSEEMCGGTSEACMRYVTAWLNGFAAKTGLPLSCSHLSGEEVTMRIGGPLDRALGQGCVIVAGVCLGADHYVLLTGIDSDDKVLLFDPYYDTWPLHELDVPVVGVELVEDRPFSHNRAVERWVFDAPAGTPYSLAQKTPREAVVLRRTDLKGAIEVAAGF